MWLRSSALFPAAAVALAAFLLRPAAYAADPEVDALRREVEDLKRTVDELKAKSAAPVVPAEQPKYPVQGADTLPAPTKAVTDSATAVPAQPALQPPAAVSSAAVHVEMGDRDLLGLRRAWRQIQPGVPESVVAAKLGPATRQLKINGKRVWYYIYPDLGAGSVFFNDDGRVSSSRSPSLGWDW